MARKEKMIQKAQKFIQKGNMDKALAEYRAVAAIDPNDITIGLRIGELCVKTGKKDEAIKEYSNVARANTHKGFYLKAIAVYKQVLKLDDTILEVHYKLAELYGKQKLVVDAISEFTYLANYYEKSGKPGEVVTLYQMMLDIDPENIGVRLKFAEQYQKQNFDKDALAEYATIFTKLIKDDKYDRAERIYIDLYNSYPNEPQVVTGLADIYKHNGDDAQYFKFTKRLFDIHSGEGNTFGAMAAKEDISKLESNDPEVAAFIDKFKGSLAAESVEGPVEAGGGEEAPAEGLGAEPSDEAGVEIKPEEVEEAEELVESEVGAEIEVEVEVPVEPEKEEEIEISLEGFDEEEEEVQVEEAAPVEEEAPAQVEEAAPVEEEAPAQVEEAAPVEEEAPAQVEEAAPVEEEAPAQVEEAAPAEEAISDAISELMEKMEPGGPLVDTSSTDKVNVEEGVAESRDEYVDLSAELGIEESGSLPSSTQSSARANETYDEFRTGLEKQLGKEDSETHYNLGIAYMEMELFKEASKEFKLASIDPNLAFDCYTRLGLSATAESNYDGAIGYYMKALKVEGRAEVERRGCMYELALAYEAMSNAEEAAALFMSINEVDPGYREVAEKVKNLAAGGAEPAAHAMHIPMDDGLMEVELL